MSAGRKKINGQKELANDLGIGTYVHPPQAPKSSLPEYAAGSLFTAPVAAEGRHIASRTVLPFTSADDEDWQALFDSVFGKGKRTAVAAVPDNADEEGRLEALIQTIVERGQEMLPLLRLLREKARSDKRLHGLVDLLQSRLSLGINAACSLAPREMEVLELAAKGESNPQIARDLNLQTVTVAKALSRAYRKLDAKNRTEAVQKWMLLRGMRP